MLPLGCGGGDDGDGDDGSGGETGGIDVSTARVERVARANCKRDSMCDPEAFASKHSDVDECTEDALDNVDRPSSAAQRKCADATLDAAECFANVACDGDPDEACGDLKVAYQTACD